MEVLYFRKDDMYYLVNLEIDQNPLASKYVDSFLKFGYFEPVVAIEEDTYRKLEAYLER